MTKAGCKHYATTGNPDTKTASTRRKHTQLYGSRSGPGHSQRFGADLQLLLLATILLQLQQFASAAPTAQPDKDATDATVATTPTTIAAGATELGPMGDMQQHSFFISYKEHFHNELHKSSLEWQNPCGGDWTGKPVMPKPFSSARRCKLRKKVLHDLQINTGRELRDLRAEDNLKRNSSTLAIDSSHVSTWAHYKASYEFLPHISINASQVTLRQMHRDMQFYVAAFARTRRAQLQKDFAKQTESPAAAELLGLVSNSRRVLCNIETANNETIRLHPRLLSRSKNLGISEPEMEQLVKRFNNYKELVQLDKIFLKYHYKQYLKQITQVLAKERKKKCLPVPAGSKLSQKTKHKSQGGANPTAKRKKLGTKRKQKQKQKQST